MSIESRPTQGPRADEHPGGSAVEPPVRLCVRDPAAVPDLALLAERQAARARRPHLQGLAGHDLPAVDLGLVLPSHIEGRVGIESVHL